MDPIKDYILYLYHKLLLNKGHLYKVDYQGLYYRFLYSFNISRNHVHDFELYLPPFDENDPKYEDPRIPRNLLLGFDKNGYGMFRWYKENNIANLIKDCETYILGWIRRKDYIGNLKGFSRLIFEWLLFNFCKDFFYYTSSIRVNDEFIKEYKRNSPEIKFLPFLLNLCPALLNKWRFFSITLFNILLWLKNNAELSEYVKKKHKLRYTKLFKKFEFFNKNPSIYPLYFTKTLVVLAKMGTFKEYELLKSDSKKIEWLNEIKDEFNGWIKKDEIYFKINRFVNYKNLSPIIFLTRL